MVTPDRLTLFSIPGAAVYIVDPNGAPYAEVTIHEGLTITRKQMRQFKHAALEAKRITQ